MKGHDPLRGLDMDDIVGKNWQKTFGVNIVVEREVVQL